MHSRYFLSSLLASSLLLGAGCQVRTSAPEAVIPTGEQPRQAPLPTTATNWDHPYYPLRLGTKSSYTSQAAGRSSRFSWEVRSSNDDKVRLHYAFERGLEMDSELSCGEDGLRAKTYLDLSSVMSGGNVKAKTISSSGHFLPRELAIGTRWESAYEVEIENTSPQAAQLGMSANQMNLHTKNTVIAEEQVTVAAGTFTALKVESKNTMKMKLSPTLPEITSSFTTFNYFVRGKGLVKSTTTDERLGTSSIEATEIYTP